MELEQKPNVGHRQVKLSSHHSYIELVFIIVHATVGRGHNFLLSTNKIATDHDGGEGSLRNT